MAKKVFFCFHYQDVIDRRVQVVRNRWLSSPDHEDGGFFDEPTWDESSMSGQASIKRLIAAGLENTSVTCVLIGALTYARRWVRYEIIESVQRGNRVVGVHINGIPDRSGRTKPAGRNPLQSLALSFTEDGASIKVLQFSNQSWIPCPESAGWPLSRPASPARRGKSQQLSTLYSVYDWASDDGPGNFDRWIGA